MNVALMLVAFVAVGTILYMNKDAIINEDVSPDSAGDTSSPSVDYAGKGASGNPTDGGDVVGVAVSLLKQFEGFSPTPYNDPPGSSAYSIGYGHQIKPGENLKHVDSATAERLLNVDVSSFWGFVSSKVLVALTTNQAAALTSFCYNIGQSAFAGSTMLRALNSGQYDVAAAEFPKWVHINHGPTISEALVSRRQQEQDLFLS